MSRVTNGQEEMSKANVNNFYGSWVYFKACGKIILVFSREREEQK